jgi:tripartite-type tricarboxylate transporter receptor subunit TctC
MRTGRTVLLVTILTLLGFTNDLLTAHAQEPFYQGKTITLVAGTTAGSQYDAHARLIAQHLGKHIPGIPDIIVQNMPGAGSLIAANHLYNVAKPDGLTITSIIPAIYFNQLAGRKEVRFDYSKFNWIGSVDRSDNLIYMRSDTPFKTIYDVRGATQPPKCTATGTGIVGHYMPKLLNETIGTKFEIVLGYPGGPEMDLAVEKTRLSAARLPTRLGSVASLIGRGRPKDSFMC